MANQYSSGTSHTVVRVCSKTTSIPSVFLGFIPIFYASSIFVLFAYNFWFRLWMLVSRTWMMSTYWHLNIWALSSSCSTHKGHLSVFGSLPSFTCLHDIELSMYIFGEFVLDCLLRLYTFLIGFQAICFIILGIWGLVLTKI